MSSPAVAQVSGSAVPPACASPAFLQQRCQEDQVSSGGLRHPIANSQSPNLQSREIPMTETRQPLHTGGCQCGAVRYALYGQPTNPHVCHCRMCQKAFGNYFVLLVRGPP